MPQLLESEKQRVLGRIRRRRAGTVPPTASAGVEYHPPGADTSKPAPITGAAAEAELEQRKFSSDTSRVLARILRKRKERAAKPAADPSAVPGLAAQAEKRAARLKASTPQRPALGPTGRLGAPKPLADAPSEGVYDVTDPSRVPEGYKRTRDTRQGLKGAVVEPARALGRVAKGVGKGLAGIAEVPRIVMHDLVRPEGVTGSGRQTLSEMTAEDQGITPENPWEEQFFHSLISAPTVGMVDFMASMGKVVNDGLAQGRPDVAVLGLAKMLSVDVLTGMRETLRALQDDPSLVARAPGEVLFGLLAPVLIAHGTKMGFSAVFSEGTANRIRGKLANGEKLSALEQEMLDGSLEAITEAHKSKAFTGGYREPKPDTFDRALEGARTETGMEAAKAQKAATREALAEVEGTEGPGTGKPERPEVITYMGKERRQATQEFEGTERRVQKQKPRAAEEPPPKPAPPTEPPAPPEPPKPPPKPAPPAEPKPPPSEPKPKPVEGAEPPADTPAVALKDLDLNSEQFQQTEIPTADLVLDPKRMQYKVNVDVEGKVIGHPLFQKGAKFSRGLADNIIVWIDPKTGKPVVVDGHQRTLRARMDDIPTLQATVLPNSIYKTAEQARAFGAVKNIASQHGTPIDVGKLFRDTKMDPEELRSYGVSPDSRFVQQGKALAQLDDFLFEQVIHESFPVERAVIIGERLPKAADQRALIKLIDRETKRGRTITNEVVANLADKVRSAGETVEKQTDLFGDIDTSMNLAVEEARIESAIQRLLKKRQTKLGDVARESVADILEEAGSVIDRQTSKGLSQSAAESLVVFGKFKDLSGPVRDAVQLAARELSEGRNEQAIIKDLYERLPEIVDEALGRREGRGAPEAGDRQGQGDLFGEEVIDPNVEPAVAGAMGGGLTFRNYVARGMRHARDVIARRRPPKPPEGEPPLPKVTVVDEPHDIGLLQGKVATPGGVAESRMAREGAGEARQAIHRTLFTERDILKLTDERRTTIVEALQEIPKDFRKTRRFGLWRKDWGKVAELLDERSMREVEQMELPEGVRAPILRIKALLEGDRQTLIADMRARGMEVADDWGKGTRYFPHIFPGNYMVRVVRHGQTQVIGSARTKVEAAQLIFEHVKQSGRVDAGAFRIERKSVLPHDMLRTSNKNLWRIAKEMGDALEFSPKDVRAAMRGQIGATESKTKFFGHALKRTGAQGFSTDVPAVLGIYNRSFVRYRELSKANREIQPLLSKLREQNKGALADYVEENFKKLWGVRADWAIQVDNQLRSMPGIRHLVGDFFAERWLSNIRRTVGMLTLKTLRFHALNSTQILSTGWPLLSTSELAHGVKMFQSKEGRLLLEQYGIIRGVMSPAEPGATVRISPSVRLAVSRYTPLGSETRNQSLAWLSFFDKGRKAGLSDAAANDYAFINGQVRTQFLNLASDQPTLFRGPAGKTVGQFKRFPIKNVELGIQLARTRPSGFAKWFGMQWALGGVRALDKGLVAGAGGFITMQAYNAIKEQFGETTADIFAGGVPTFLGTDFGSSVQILDLPLYADSPAEVIGEMAMPAAGSLAWRALRSLSDQQGTRERGGWEKAWDAVKDMPTFKQVDGLYRVLERDVEWRDHSDKLKYRGEVYDIFLQMGGFTSWEKSKQSMLVDGVIQHREMYDEALVEAMQKYNAGQPEAAQAVMDRWNTLYPNVRITPEDLQRRLKAREATQELDTLERVLKGAGKKFKEEYTP